MDSAYPVCHVIDAVNLFLQSVNQMLFHNCIDKSSTMIIFVFILYIFFLYCKKELVEVSWVPIMSKIGQKHSHLIELY